jgi:hypothetical protein
VNGPSGDPAASARARFIGASARAPTLKPVFTAWAVLADTEDPPWTLEELRRPVSPAAVEQFERSEGLAVPSELRALYDISADGLELESVSASTTGRRR